MVHLGGRTMKEMIEELTRYCRIVHGERWSTNAFLLEFDFEEVKTTIGAILHDEQSGANLAIVSMTTLPPNATGRGCGSRALQTLIRIAKKHGLSHIQAVQVQRPAENFWKKNGFVSLGNKTNDFKYSPQPQP